MNLVIVELTRHSVTLSSAEFFAHLLPPFVALSEFSNFNILPLPDSSLIPLALHVRPIRTVAVLSPPLSYPSTLYDGTATLPLLLSRLISPTESATVFPICRSLFFPYVSPFITPEMSSCDLSLSSPHPFVDPCHPPNRFHRVMPPPLSSPSKIPRFAI